MFGFWHKNKQAKWSSCILPYQKQKTKSIKGGLFMTDPKKFRNFQCHYHIQSITVQYRPTEKKIVFGLKVPSSDGLGLIL